MRYNAKLDDFDKDRMVDITTLDEVLQDIEETINAINQYSEMLAILDDLPEEEVQRLETRLYSKVQLLIYLYIRKWELKDKTPYRFEMALYKDY